MIKFIEGNIFESPAQTLVNTVNTVGAMGKGIAKSYKRLFPEMFKEYQELCENGKIDIGVLWVYRTSHKWVLNFPTKEHWRQASKIEYIEKGLKEFLKCYESMRISSIAFPRIGCGNGELDWNDVKPLMESYLKNLPIDIYIYETHVPLSPEHKNIKMMKEWLKTEPFNYPFEEFKNDLMGIITEKNEFIQKDQSFKITQMDNGVEINVNGKSSFIPWLGDEYCKGWLDIWQYIRVSERCTAKELINMGFEHYDEILSFLLSLEYLQELKIMDKKDTMAIQLKPVAQPEENLNLFNKKSEPQKVINLE